MRCKHNKRT